MPAGDKIKCDTIIFLSSNVKLNEILYNETRRKKESQYLYGEANKLKLL